MKTKFEALKAKSEELKTGELISEIDKFVDELVKNQNEDLLTIQKSWKSHGTWKSSVFVNEFEYGQELKSIIEQSVNGTITHDEEKEFKLDDFKENISDNIYCLIDELKYDEQEKQPQQEYTATLKTPEGKEVDLNDCIDNNGKLEKNKIYAFVLEGENQKGEELGLIAEDDLTVKGVANVYEQSKELWNNRSLSKCFIFGIDNKSNVYIRRPDQLNFENNKTQFAKDTLEIDENYEKKKSYPEYLLQKIETIDKLYNVGLMSLYKDMTKTNSTSQNNNKYTKQYIGNAKEQVSKKNINKTYLSATIDYDKLQALPSSEKGSKYLAISELKEPDQYGNTHSIYKKIKDDKYSKINLCFSKENLEKMQVSQGKNSDKQYVNFYVSEISAEKKAEKNINADYSIYQYDKDKNKTTFIGAGFDAEKQRNQEQNKEKTQNNEQER